MESDRANLFDFLHSFNTDDFFQLHYRIAGRFWYGAERLENKVGHSLPVRSRFARGRRRGGEKGMREREWVIPRSGLVMIVHSGQIHCCSRFVMCLSFYLFYRLRLNPLELSKSDIIV